LSALFLSISLYRLTNSQKRNLGAMSKFKQAEAGAASAAVHLLYK